MLTRKFLLFACLMFGMATGACAARGADPLTLTSKDAGSTVHVKQGDVVTIALEGNPTTGYTWEVAPGSGVGLEQQGEPQFKPDSNARGAGGTMTLQFKASQPGTYPLKLIYHRTFEPNVPPLKSFEAVVVVE